MIKREKKKKEKRPHAGEIHTDIFVKAKVSEGQWIIAGHEKLR